jgi:hypothetical protein
VLPVREFSSAELDSFCPVALVAVVFMLIRNYAKPFCIAGFILAEIYMLLIVLAPYGQGQGRRLPVPIPFEEPNVPSGTPRPLATTLTTIAVLAVFMGPFGALAGLGVGLLVSAVLQWLAQRRSKPAKPPTD